MTQAELNREYPELDDADVFQRMVNVTTRQMTSENGRMHRAQHAKATGCVTAEFIVNDAVRADLRHGIFQRPGRSFKAIVRFSNAQSTFHKDGVGTARGMAIKLLDVEGDRALPRDDDRTQDFLMVDHKVFPFPDPRAYVETMARKGIPLVGDLVATAHMALLEPKELRIVRNIRAQTVASPLEITYWSGSPYWLGPAAGESGNAVKYSAVSRRSGATALPENPEDLPDDYLSRAIAAGLRSNDAVFDFRVQLQKDPVAMPVEDVSVEWDEVLSEPITLATLRIPRQAVDPASDFALSCETMSFSPWHALAEHRPLGGINRLRKVVYEASLNKRTSP
jgi:hypothetical protein